MLREERIEMTFERSHVQEPLVYGMARRWPDVYFNIHNLSVGPHEARIVISLVGEVPDLRAVREHFAALGVQLRLIEELKYKGKLPVLPKRVAMPTAVAEDINKKVWITIVGSMRSQSFMWTISRRYDVLYRITQSVTGDPVSIMSLHIQGKPAEVDGVIAYLREQGINVEVGETPKLPVYEPAGS